VHFSYNNLKQNWNQECSIHEQSLPNFLFDGKTCCLILCDSLNVSQLLLAFTI
jgi:hypothetical protein